MLILAAVGFSIIACTATFVLLPTLMSMMSDRTTAVTVRAR